MDDKVLTPEALERLGIFVDCLDEDDGDLGEPFSTEIIMPENLPDEDEYDGGYDGEDF